MGSFTFSNILSDVGRQGLGESVLPPLILNMSITASVIILFVLLARLALKKAPKIFSYALWAVVLFRLLCPVSVTTDFSLLGLFDPPAVENTQHTTAVEYVPYDVVHTPELEVQLPVPPVINEAVNNALPQEHAALGADPLEGEFAIGSFVWLLGVAAMVVYSVVTYLLLRRKLVGAVPLRGNIYLADHIGSPFVLGLFRPRIFLPSSLSEQERGYIILHEQHHIRRLDHVVKWLAFIALCIHWFNPLVWVAFVLSSKDMEMSCDEAVVKKLGEGIRADYSASLLSLATGRRIIAGTPLAFGEGDTKSRIKNMLNWKRAKPVVVAVSAVAVVLAVIFCGTNAASGSWFRGKYDAGWVRLSCRMDEPIQSYAIYEDIYENGELISSTPRIMDSFRDNGGATPRKFSFSLMVRPVHAKTGAGFDGQLLCTWKRSGSKGSWETALPKYHYTGSGASHEYSEDRQSLDTESDIVLVSRVLSTDPEGLLTLNPGDKTLAESNDTVVVYRLVTSAGGVEQYVPETGPNASGELADGSYGTAADIAYYLELAADTEFQNMNLDRQTSLLVEYEDLLDDYTFIARESKDGTTAYIVGQYNGNPLESPLHGMYSIDMYTGEEDYFRFLYREEEVETVEAVVAANKTEFPPSVGYRIEDSVISWTENSGVILIQPKENTLLLDVPWNRYFYTPNGREYIADAVSRGIDLCGRTNTFLYVYRISEQFGEISERIALTEAEAQAILAEERVSITDGFGFSATLHIDGQTTYYNEREGVPQTVLDLAVEKCDYRFGDPSYITDTIREARLDMSDLDRPLYASEADLPRLREILKNAEHGYVGSCGYGAKLTLTFTGGEKLTVFKGCDDCDTIVFGSYGGYFLGDKENIEFWEMFGVDPVTKIPLQDGPADPEQHVAVFNNGEVTVSLPAKYADLVKVDDIGSDNMFTVAANLYYKPEYTANDNHAPMTNGGWMMTVQTTSYTSAEALFRWPEPGWSTHTWDGAGRSVYVERRAVEGEYRCSEENLEEFKAVMASIRVDYGTLPPFDGTRAVEDQVVLAQHSDAALRTAEQTVTNYLTNRYKLAGSTVFKSNPNVRSFTLLQVQADLTETARMAPQYVNRDDSLDLTPSRAAQMVAVKAVYALDWYLENEANEAEAGVHAVYYYLLPNTADPSRWQVHDMAPTKSSQEFAIPTPLAPLTAKSVSLAHYTTSAELTRVHETVTNSSVGVSRVGNVAIYTDTDTPAVYLIAEGGMVGRLPLPYAAAGRYAKQGDNHLDMERMIYAYEATAAQQVLDPATGAVLSEAGTYRYVVDLENRRYVTLFAPAETDPAEKSWGLSMKAADATASGVTLVFTQSGGDYTDEMKTGYTYLVTGGDYDLEVLRDGRWTPVPVRLENRAVTAAGYGIPYNDSLAWPIDLAAVYGELSPGTYRIAKEIRLGCRGDRDDETRLYYAEFSLTGRAFSAEDENFSGRAVATEADPMTYAERLAWVKAGPTEQTGISFIPSGPYTEGDGCLAYLGQWVGTPHASQYQMVVRFADGTQSTDLPLPFYHAFAVGRPDFLSIRSGKLIYEVAFDEEATAPNGQSLLHLKGVYRYEVDLAAKTVSLTVRAG